MTCTTPRATSTPATTVAVMTAAATLSLPAPATIRAQTTPATPTPAAPQPVVTTAVPAVIAAYRAPALALVQPSASGGALTVPQDKPVVVFRFAQGEADDPVDAATFRVSVDGRDRTALFQIAAGQAWGPLGEPSSGASSGTSALVSAGAHQVAARVCIVADATRHRARAGDFTSAISRRRRRPRSRPRHRAGRAGTSP